MAFALVVGSVTLVPASQASFPGLNGKIAFFSNRDGDFYEIYVMNADGTNPIRLTNSPGVDEVPEWSPDGTKIAFDSERNGNFEVYVMNADGTGQTRLTNNPAHDLAPAWSPDGTKIAFISNRDGQQEIYVMNADGTNPIRLTNSPGDDGGRNWSPDGTKIGFASNRTGRYEIYVMNADGTGVTQLTNNSVPDGAVDPSWSPNGTKIAFMSNTNFANEIYVMNADGTGVTQLTNNTVVDAHPAWQPAFYSFSGFLQPVDNTPVFNLAKAGSAIPVKFSLNGNQGLSIFASGYPKSQQIACETSAPLDGIEETVTAGSSSLSYDATTDRYTYVWKTDKAWANTCRKLTVQLNDSTDHVAYFNFKK